MRRLSAARALAVIPVFLLSALAAGASGCSSSNSSACNGGKDCVDIQLSGAASGTVSSASAPAGFRIFCQSITSPRPIWVSHEFGQLKGETWLVIVQANSYSGPGPHTGTITLGLLPATGSRATRTYFGQGTITVAKDGAAARFSASLQPIGVGGGLVTAKGDVGCVKMTTPS